MDVQNAAVAGVTISGAEDEDPAEYFNGQANVGELPDPFVDRSEANDTMKAKQKELDRLAEFGVYEAVGILVAQGKKRVTRRWELGRNQCAIRRKRVQGR